MTAAMPTTVADFIETVNRHDEQGFLNAFAEDGFVDDWGRVFTGRDEIKAWSDKEFIGATGTMTVTDTHVDGDRVTVIADWRSTHANGLSKFVFDVAADKLASMTIREG
ncbi:nuclear transport factor 2 family protein [Gordonia sp. HY442]|uniref:nuclear transport factor 2 family protein n=1 Tax=Gordonia zhenghanii TaxID=2911516 RepID=UPI001F2B55C0|nr:nuclear transport factor 2 family protein [Gordonia zhenghanii]MCF8606521.1 nuclear transport factor 2 family protein [Gordonia zhenghanii]